MRVEEYKQLEMDVSCVLAALLVMLPQENHERDWVCVKMLTLTYFIFLVLLKIVLMKL